jgi:FixJ family two-component response regulator
MTSNIPIIIITGNLDIEILGSTNKDGAAGFITKPIKEVVLLKKINEIPMPANLFDFRI